MKDRNWLHHLRESLAAAAVGGQIVPMGDNRDLRHSLAVRLAEMRREAAQAQGPPRSTTASGPRWRTRADDLD
jgi:hypothetical protein